VEKLRLFTREVCEDRHLLTGFLRYVGARCIERANVRNLKDLRLTASPRIIDGIAPFLAEAAADAGFRSATAIPEHRCLFASRNQVPRLAEEAIDRPECIGRCGQRPERLHDPGGDVGPPRADYSLRARLILDVGHEGSRFYAYVDGEHRLDLDDDTPHGGSAMLRRIRKMVESRYELQIGPRTTEHVLRLASRSNEGPLTIKGKDLSCGRPAGRSIPIEVAVTALRPVHDAILDLCQTGISGLAPQHRATARLLLAGGAAGPLLARMLDRCLDCHVDLVQNPAELSLRGLSSLDEAGPSMGG
jgi:hypothetical protein